MQFGVDIASDLIRFVDAFLCKVATISFCTWIGGIWSGNFAITKFELKGLVLLLPSEEASLRDRFLLMVSVFVRIALLGRCFVRVGCYVLQVVVDMVRGYRIVRAYGGVNDVVAIEYGA